MIENEEAVQFQEQIPEQEVSGGGEQAGDVPSPKSGNRLYSVFVIIFMFLTILIFGILYLGIYYTDSLSGIFPANSKTESLPLDDVTNESSLSETLEEVETETSATEEATPSEANPQEVIQQELDHLDSINLSDFEIEYRDSSLNDLN